MLNRCLLTSRREYRWPIIRPTLSISAASFSLSSCSSLTFVCSSAFSLVSRSCALSFDRISSSDYNKPVTAADFTEIDINGEIVVGVASRMIEAVVVPGKQQQQQERIQLRRRCLTMARRTGGVSCVSCNVRSM